MSPVREGGACEARCGGRPRWFDDPVPGGLDAIPNVAWYFEDDGLKLLDEL